MALGCEVAAVRVASVGSEYSEYDYSEYTEYTESKALLSACTHLGGEVEWRRVAVEE